MQVISAACAGMSLRMEGPHIETAELSTFKFWSLDGSQQDLLSVCVAVLCRRALRSSVWWCGLPALAQDVVRETWSPGPRSIRNIGLLVGGRHCDMGSASGAAL